MKLYDISIPVHETTEGEPSINDSIEKLDEMLTQYGIDHCFALPTYQAMNLDPKPLVYNLYYRSEQNTELTLVISLWLKIYLNRETNRILEAIEKSLKNTA